MAIAAVRHVGVQPADSCQALDCFINACRLLEMKGTANGVTVYDDFAQSHGYPGAACGAAQQNRWHGTNLGGTGAPFQHHEMCKNKLAPSLLRGVRPGQRFLAAGREALCARTTPLAG
ncbi:MAG: UDP-N-acetylmuramate--L-alanyl-gamma-D-glutamyl-meso-2,6-diaminoheptandioate ligase [Sodalis sp.]|nr:MAG: UDP-N-acetylmuramate--L-alanyl-gamma-D-glutamyl-meso-2,6-diaminoheptandioate ligase [Sodalis sp.]